MFRSFPLVMQRNYSLARYLYSGVHVTFKTMKIHVRSTRLPTLRIKRKEANPCQHHDGDEAAPNEKSGHGYTASQPMQARGCEKQ